MRTRKDIATVLASAMLLGAPGYWQGQAAAEAAGPASVDHLSPEEAAVMIREKGSDGISSFSMYGLRRNTGMGISPAPC